MVDKRNKQNAYAAAYYWRQNKRRYETDPDFRAKMDAIGRGPRFQQEAFSYLPRKQKEEKAPRERVPLKLRRSWGDMIQRCYNEKNCNYRYYGARGVTVCDAWRNDRRQFYQWALTSGWAPGLSIDRLDPTQPYSPVNCEWVTRSENTRRMSLRRWGLTP